MAGSGSACIYDAQTALFQRNVDSSIVIHGRPSILSDAGSSMTDLSSVLSLRSPSSGSFEDVLIFGALLMMGFYHLVIFALSRSDVAGLVFGFHGPVLLTTHLFFVVLLGEKLVSSVWLTPVGVMVFVLAQSGLLAHRFSQALTSSERLSSRLEAEIGHRTRLQRKLDSVVDEERRFVSRALHDGLCQDLTAARLHCALWRSSSGGGTEAFRKVSELLERAVDQAYELSRGLWPTDQDIADLPGALRDLGATVSAEHGLAVTVRCEAGAADFSESEREHIFQIAKEALTNVVKHAEACHASVELRSEGDGDPLLVVEDDGVGLAAGAPGKGGLGRRIMSHHAQAVGGVLALSSRPEGGTRIELSVPRPRAYV
jgi:signal transduction histidine kinase